MKLFLSLIMSLLLIGTSNCYAFDPEIGEQPKPVEGLEFVLGGDVDLSSFKGKPLVVYVGADWCEPCVVRGRPTALKVHQKYSAQGLQTIFVSADDNKLRNLKIDEAKATGLLIAMPVLTTYPPGKMVKGRHVLGSFGQVYFYPTAVVIDADGIVRAKMDHGKGVASGLEPAVDKVMQAFIKSR
jgi:thiol-disulfide isomerase/thioredoxin